MPPHIYTGNAQFNCVLPLTRMEKCKRNAVILMASSSISATLMLMVRTSTDGRLTMSMAISVLLSPEVFTSF